MKTLRSQIDIDAPAERVWDTLTKIADYPTWNQFIPRLAGTLAPGERLEVRIEPPGGAAMTFRPTVLVVETERELRWVGHLLIPGLFDGEHQFELHPLGPGRVRFVQEERFTGVLVPLFARNLDAHTLPGFTAMNAALKARAEASVANHPRSSHGKYGDSSCNGACSRLHASSGVLARPALDISMYR